MTFVKEYLFRDHQGKFDTPMGHSRMHPQSAEGAGRNDCQTLSSLKVNGEWEKYLRTAEKLVTPVFTNSREEMMGNQ